MKKATKKEIFSIYGIEYDRKTNKIFHPVLGWINLLLINGNAKIGKGAYHFSTLPTNKIFHLAFCGLELDIKGTCLCSCDGCYATKGNYCFKSTKKALGIRTWLVYNDLDFVRRAITAQIKAMRIKMCRIHASGDFCNMDYINTWKEIVKACEDCVFWSYTKNAIAENAFNDFDNINIVKSCIQGIGFNFGTCAYIMKVYNILKEMKKDVYICRCGIDSNQHCTNCKGCSKNEYVLFIEHSTSYIAKNDPLYDELKDIIERQPKA